MITEIIDISLGLVNGAIVEFYGFADSDGALIRDEIIATPPAYMLIKLKHDVGVEIALPGLPPSVVGIEPISITYKPGRSGKAVTYLSFPPRSPMPSLIINVRDKRSDGSLWTSRSLMEAILLHLRRTFNYLEPKLSLLYPSFVFSIPANYELLFLKTY